MGSSLGSLERGGRPQIPGWLRSLGSGILLGLTVSLVTLAYPPGSGSDGPAPLDDLLVKAAQRGTIRVIVKIRLEAPGAPTPEAIALGQDLVLQELAGTGHRVHRRYTTIPFLSLEVTADALRRLGASGRVAGIREERVLRPQ
jgi:hypothetical protein